MLKTFYITTLSLFLFLISFSSCVSTSTSTSNISSSLTIPKTDCEIRAWYNYQVVAIPKLNEYWIEQGIGLEERAKKAFELRHNARVYARFMMEDKEDVKKLMARDQEKYGNPNGPTFDYLVQKNKTEGKSEEEAYQAIIDSASQTNQQVNNNCK